MAQVKGRGPFLLVAWCSRLEREHRRFRSLAEAQGYRCRLGCEGLHHVRQDHDPLAVPFQRL